MGRLRVLVDGYWVAYYMAIEQEVSSLDQQDYHCASCSCYNWSRTTN